MMLLSGMADISEMLCISPAGHGAVESWSVLGCAPEPEGVAGAAEMSEHGPCVDCSDYSLLPPAAFGNRTAPVERTALAAASYHAADAYEPRAAAYSFSPFPGDSPSPDLSPLPLRC
jgi:hypothetical protein